ncbi:MAG: NUDIX domain-containing protein [Bacilli bacterium]
MPISTYLRELRQQVGCSLLLIPAVAAVVRDDEGRVLLQRRSDNGEWSLPAGSVEPGEAPTEALVREVWEETGLHVLPRTLLGVFGGAEFRAHYPNGDQAEYTVLLFECERLSGKLQPMDDESLELRYFSPDSMPDLGLAYPREVFRTDPGERTMFQWDPDWLARLK